MKFKEYALMALRDLGKRKGRTILTALGITIGTLLIVTMVGLGTGLKDFMVSTVNSEGNSKKISIQPYRYFTEEDTMDFDMNTFEEDYFKKLDDTLIKEVKDTGKVDTLSAYINFTASKIKIDGKAFTGMAQITGYNTGADVFPEWYVKEKKDKVKDENLKPIKLGRDVEKETGEVLIGEKILKGLNINPEDILNKELEITVDNANGITITPLVKKFAIVGIIDENFNEGEKFTVSAKDAAELKGYSFLQKDYLNNKGYDAIDVIAKEISDVEPLTNKIKELDYFSSSTVDMAKEVEESLGGISIAFAVLGVVVLVVAAIGIVNTMSMAVLERTKSIGVMKSVGANSEAIRSIFLVQSSIIGFIGGAVGILLATGINALIQFGINAYVEKQGFTMSISIGLPWFWIIGILGFAIVIALISGIAPAIRASKLDPIEALRR
ncbi:ABC transporter permease [Clostridium paraputrificum]|uniref:ABC transporter permease n=1 Tax=Clostridium TaxID=1485 RepID=UPI003D333A24